MRKYELDQIDKKILDILMEEAKKPLKEIAEAVFLSVPAVSGRIKRMEEAGYILGYQVKMDFARLGFPTKAFIWVQVSHERRKEFCSYIEEKEEVVECDCLTGEYCVLLKAYFLSMAELEAFAQEVQRFGETKINVVFSTPIEHRNRKVPF